MSQVANDLPRFYARVNGSVQRADTPDGHPPLEDGGFEVLRTMTVEPAVSRKSHGVAN
jgi:hypothetical protein